MNQVKFEKLQWSTEVLGRDPGNAKGNRLAAHALFAVRGQLPASLPFLHVVTVEEGSDVVWAPLVAEAAKLAADAAGEVRLPQAGAYLPASSPSTVQVVAADRLLSVRDLATLLGGQAPKGDGGTDPEPPPPTGSTT